MATFPEVDVENLILAMSQRPELWDTTLECYKDRNSKKMSWLQLYSQLFHGFDTMNKMEKLFIAKGINSRWRTIRDGYVKSKKKEKDLKMSGSSRPPQKYVHAHLLSFLDKCLDSQEDAYCVPGEEAKVAVGSEFPTGLSDKINHPHIKPSQSDFAAINVPLALKKKRNENTDKEQPISNFQPTRNEPQSLTQQPDDEDDDLTFFRSLLPMLKPLSNETKLRFRIQVMNSLQMVLLSSTSSNSFSGFVSKFPKTQYLSSRRYQPYHLQEMAFFRPQPSSTPSTFVSQSSK